MNVILIGMAGAGKSSVGVVLAKRLGYDFIDSDLLIQRRHGRRLPELIAAHGRAGFCRIEEEVILSLRVEQTVVATGGSVVYSEAAMTHLGQLGRLVFLDTPLKVLQRRVGNLEQRGLIIEPGEDFAGLYARRLPLYRYWANMTVACAARPVRQIVAELERLLLG